VRDPAGKDVLTLGYGDQPVFLRSAAKPFQVMPAVLSGGIDRFGVTDQELAVLCASHHAEPRQIEAVLSVLAKIDLDEASLHCGTHPPIHEDTARMLWREAKDPSAVYNNCSGAHTGMLVACVAEGWPIDTYEQPDHPLQRRTRSILAAFAGMAEQAVRWATDNCAVPTFRVPISRAATAFARIVSGEGISADLRDAGIRVNTAMISYPEMVGGEQSWDTALMRAAHGSLLAKGGADGFQGIGTETMRLGIAVKISDGNSKATPPAILAVLEHLGVLDDEVLEHLRALAGTEILNHRGEVVGSMVSALRFKGDV
jgi:L-asparaginase II